MARVYLSLGSNLGGRVANIRSALEALGDAGLTVLRVSSLYKTEPVDLRSQPWFVNCVAEANTNCAPLELLGRLKSLEQTFGQRSNIPKGPRPMDIDILLYGDVVLETPALTIPHPRMGDRRFVLVPLAEIASQVLHPVTHATISVMLDQTKDGSQVVRLEKGDEPAA